MTAQSPRPQTSRPGPRSAWISGEPRSPGEWSRATGRSLTSSSVPTPATGDTAETLEALRKVIDSLRDRHPAVEAIGAGAAGMVEWPSGHIRWAPNNAYRELPLRQLLAQETGLPAVVDNDANVAAWAEARHGAAAGYGHVAVLTVGTGIGAGVVLGGQLQRGHSGLGGEIGHIISRPRRQPVRLRQHRLPGGNGLRNRPGPRRARSRRSRPGRNPGHPGRRPGQGHRPGRLRRRPARRPHRPRAIRPDRLLARHRHRLGCQSPGYRASRHRRRPGNRGRPAASSRQGEFRPLPVRPRAAAAPGRSSPHASAPTPAWSAPPHSPSTMATCIVRCSAMRRQHAVTRRPNARPRFTGA